MLKERPEHIWGLFLFSYSNRPLYCASDCTGGHSNLADMYSCASFLPPSCPMEVVTGPAREFFCILYYVGSFLSLHSDLDEGIRGINLFGRFVDLEAGRNGWPHPALQVIICWTLALFERPKYRTMLHVAAPVDAGAQWILNNIATPLTTMVTAFEIYGSDARRHRTVRSASLSFLHGPSPLRLRLGRFDPAAA